MSASYSIRVATSDDAAATLPFLKALADEPNNTTSFQSSAEITNTVEDEAEFIRRSSQNPMALWLLALDTDQTLIGQLNLSNGRSGGRHSLIHTVTLGVNVAPTWRDRGVGTALMREAMAWCAANENVKRLELEVMSNNARAIHVYEKLGFVREGVRQAFFLQNGRFLDLMQMAVLYDRPNLETPS